MSDWLSIIKNSKKSCVVHDNSKKIHYDFGDGKQMVEEYNLDTKIVVRRAWKCKNNIGGAEDDWFIELGDPEPNFKKDENLVIKENSSQPIVSRRATRNSLEWRIRNLPYPLQTYNVTIDSDKKCLIVKTTNKKYYKILQIPELDRLHLLPKQDAITLAHKYNTLIITYKKPKELLEFEKEVLKEIDNLKPSTESMNCTPS